MYHKLSISDTAANLDVDIKTGLSEKDAAERGAGELNVITGGKRDTLIKQFLRQFNEPLIYILLAAAAVSAVVREWKDCAVILAILILNSTIGVIQERKADRALESLKKLTTTHAFVRRGGKVREIDADGLAVGDVVLLEAGRIVPADMRLTLTSSLTVNESALTGESVAVLKDESFKAPSDIPLGDRINMAFQGTIVTGGRGEGVVVATGMSTEVGRIAEMLNEQDTGKTPLQKRMGKLGKQLGIAACAACALLFLTGLLQRRDPFELLLTAISLAVAIIPEGLTAIVTVVLAIGVTRMVSRNAIVRRLPAVETLGSVTVICTDKTGTLTQNKMTVVSVFENGDLFDLSAAGVKTQVSLPLLSAAALCCDASITDDARIGDPTELALLDFAMAHGMDKRNLEREFPRIAEIGFDSRRKMMTTLHRAENTTVSYTKGAPDVLLSRSGYIWENGSIQKLDDEKRDVIRACLESMSEKSLRVLAFAMRSGDGSPREENLIFIGLCGMMDPPREEAVSAVKTCHDAGIRVIMITGDHKATAAAIGMRVGIIASPDQVISGEELDRLGDDEFLEASDRILIYARVNPAHKLRIVKALKSRNNVVSMTGDGVNDAPSLKAADIGVAMGKTGTDAAKEASDLILTDDNFQTIAHAVEDGRNIYENIKKSIYFLLSANAGELMTIFTAVLLGWKSPLAPLHILWINLITDSLPALALGTDPPSPDVMKEKPRSPSESFFANRGLLRILVYGVVFAAVTLTVFRLTLNSTGSIEIARTYAFLTLATSQLFYAFGIRAGKKSLFKTSLFSNKLMIAAFSGGVLLQVAAVYLPFLSGLFKTLPVDTSGWLLIIPLAAVPLVFHELEVLFIKRGAANG
ncbi:MAG: cation-translocating P-type ATPase [Clostridiales bacterium]|jgi:Ca2+-transporting ATPase|nr:cation-translocating P-type ATPase [Clostridiales bacterium]